VLVTSALAVLEAAVYSTGFSSMDIKIATMLVEPAHSFEIAALASTVSLEAAYTA